MSHEILKCERDDTRVLWVQCTKCGNKIQYYIADTPRYQFLFCPVVRCNDTTCYKRKTCSDNQAQFPCDESCVIEVTKNEIRIIEPGLYWDYLPVLVKRSKTIADVTYSSNEQMIDFLPLEKDFTLTDIHFARVLGSIDTGQYYINEDEE